MCRMDSVHYTSEQHTHTFFNNNKKWTNCDKKKSNKVTLSVEDGDDKIVSTPNYRKSL